MGKLLTQLIPQPLSESLGELLGDLVRERITQFMGEFLGELIRELLTQLMGELITQCIPQCLGECFTQCLGELSAFVAFSRFQVRTRPLGHWTTRFGRFRACFELRASGSGSAQTAALVLNLIHRPPFRNPFLRAFVP